MHGLILAKRDQQIGKRLDGNIASNDRLPQRDEHGMRRVPGIALAKLLIPAIQQLERLGRIGNFVSQIVNPASALISVQAAGTSPPEPSGTVSGPITAVPAAADLRNKTVTAAIGSHETTFPLYDPRADGTAPATLAQLGLLLEAKIRRGGGALGGVRVTTMGTRLHAHGGGTDDVLNLSGDFGRHQLRCLRSRD